MRRLPALLLTIASLVWVAALVTAPLQLADRTLAVALFYDACGLICHQRPDRSFELNGVQLPVCARCFGLYLSGAGGAVLAWLGIAGSVPRAATSRWLLACAAVPTALTLAVEYLGIAQPSGALRAAAGAPLGALIGWLLVGMLRSEAPAPVRQMRYHA